MLKSVTTVWLVIFLIHALTGSVKLFDINTKRIAFGVFFRTLPVHFVIGVGAGILYTLLDGRSVNGIYPYGLVMLAAVSYMIYAVYVFGYQIIDSEFIWFNGLFRRRVSASDLKSIELLQRKNATVRIKLVTSKKTYTLRNDIGVDVLMFEFSESTGVPLRIIQI